MTMVFVDTDILVACMRPLNPQKPKANEILQKARQVLEQLFAQQPVVKITIFNYAEFYQGVYLSQHVARNLRSTDQFLAKFEISYPTPESAKEYARISAELEVKGQSIGTMDLLIASLVLLEDDELYTRNMDHFQRIPHLKFVNWMEKDF